MSAILTADSEIYLDIREMKGKPYMYRGRNLRVKDVEIEEHQIRILTDSAPVITSREKWAKTMDEFLPVEDALDNDEKEQALAIFNSGSSHLSSLEDVLMGNIKKLQEDSSFLPQAKEINSHATSMIKIAKTKVDMVKEIRKMKVM